MITAYVCNFHGLFNSHIEIFLVESSSDKRPNTFGVYVLNQWDRPSEKIKVFDQQGFDKCKAKYFERVGSYTQLTLEGDLKSLVQAWYVKTKNDIVDVYFNNCADAVAWFLDKFANIKKPEPFAKPLGCNHCACGVFLPSFMQWKCCPTLPGRVLDNTRYHVETPGRLKMI